MIAQLDPLYLKLRPSKAYVRLVSHFMFQGRFLTTNHRWLNYFILPWLRLLKEVPGRNRVEKPIFIVGTGRSGSTILGKVLSFHSQIAFLNEPKAMWFVLNSLDDLHGHFSGEGERRYLLNEEDATDTIKENAQKLFSHYLFLTGGSRLLDKNPEIIFRTDYVNEIFPDAKFLFLVRDGWDTITSIDKWSNSNRRGSEESLQDWWGLNRRKWYYICQQLIPRSAYLKMHEREIQGFSHQEDMAAVEWILTMEQGLEQLKKENYHKVPYESLTNHPTETLEEIIEFCELGDDELLSTYANEILQPVPPRNPIEISPCIKEPFDELMGLLGYERR